MITINRKPLLRCCAAGLLLAPLLAPAATPATPATNGPARGVQPPSATSQRGQSPASNARTSQPTPGATIAKPGTPPTTPTNTGGGATPKPALLEFQIPEKVVAPKPGTTEEQTQRNAGSAGKPPVKSFTLDGKGTDVNVEEVELAKAPAKPATP